MNALLGRDEEGLPPVLVGGWPDLRILLRPLRGELGHLRCLMRRKRSKFYVKGFARVNNEPNKRLINRGNNSMRCNLKLASTGLKDGVHLKQGVKSKLDH